MRRLAALTLALGATMPQAQARQAKDPAALAEAIAADDVAGTSAALTAGANANAALEYGETPLARAVETQDGALVAALLSHGAKPNIPDTTGTTPLLLACERGNAEIVGQLLDAHASPRRAGPDGATPLNVCARFAPSAVPRLLAMGADADGPDPRGQTPLMWAASAGNLDAMAALIKAGAQVNRVTRAGFTPLFFAIKSGLPDATAALIAAGADIAHRGPENTSALQLALYQKNWGAAAMLVARGGDLSEIDRNGNRPLHIVAAAGETGLLALMLAKGANPNGLTGSSRITWVTEANFGMPPPPIPPTPPLLVAAQEGQVEVMKQLVAAGANPAFVTADGTNVLLAAAHGHKTAALEYALGLAPDVNVVNGKGQTPLHVVLAEHWQPELEDMLRVLFRRGVRTDVADKDGATPVQIAEGELSSVRAAFRNVFTSPPVPR